MITITIPKKEFYLEELNEFVTVEKQTIRMEHSLISLRKWESKWHKSFLDRKDHTNEESIDYLRCMTLDEGINILSYYAIPKQEMQRVIEYIKDPMSATCFFDDNKNKGKSRRVITAEVIYYWMIELGLPIELETWHLNQLLTQIRVISSERAPKKKMSKNQMLSHYAKLNAERRAKYGTKG